MFRFWLAVIVGRLVHFVGKFSGRSTSIPGNFALKICPDFLKRLTFSGKIIAITGSNGKTTTSNQIAHILRSNGYSVADNQKGSNLTPGVVTTLLCSCKMNGVVPQDYVVLEIDERFARIIFRDITPYIFVVTILLRDQVVRNGHPDIIMDKINQGIGKDVMLVLNANDPISQNLAPDNKRVYYGMNRTSHSFDECEYITNDCKVCPHCFAPINYNFFHYNHIGDFACSKCDYKTPTPNFIADNIDVPNSTYTVNGNPITVTYNALFHFLNTTAAFATCTLLGLQPRQISSAISTFVVSKERYGKFQLDGRNSTLILSKHNPVSMDQSISYTISQTGKKTVIFFVNNAYNTFENDVSWLYDTTFERLVGKVDHVICLGTRAYDVAVRLKLAGFSPEILRVENKLENAMTALRGTEGDIYMLAATAFGDDDGLLDALNVQKL